MISPFPLAWPENFPRSRQREPGKFRTGLNTALGNVKDALHAFGKDTGKPVSDVVLSSDVSLGNQRPADPGVAVWFRWDGEMRCIPVDRYTSPEANLQAIYHVLEARRTELRHGTLALVRATFKGFVAALAPPGAKDWTEVLGLPHTASAAAINARFRELAKERHPDHGGSAEMMAELNAARDQALRGRAES